MATASFERDGEIWRVCGELDFDSVATLWNATAAVFTAAPPTRIDLGAVSRSNSAGVALLVEWFDWAEQRQRPLAFVNVSAQMQAIIALADLDTILPIA